MVGNATLTIVRSTIVMKNATASTANARQRCIWAFESVFISISFASLVVCRRVNPPRLEVVIRQLAAIHRSHKRNDTPTPAYRVGCQNSGQPRQCADLRAEPNLCTPQAAASLAENYVDRSF